jgi:hypothetical protein
MEKIHGTSAHILWKDGNLTFFSGGETHSRFVELFNQEDLIKKFKYLDKPEIVVFGEAYGGKQQGQSYRYGKELKFIAFEVKNGETWHNVQDARHVADYLGFEFVHFVEITTDLASIDAERDAPSVQAKRNGIIKPQPREGIVLRPLVESRDERGDRVICKHKREEERETKSPRPVEDPTKLKVLADAQAIALEWVTIPRLEHVLNKIKGILGQEVQIENMREVINSMIDDVTIEGYKEIVDSPEARQAISRKTALLFKEYLNNCLKESVKV